MAAIGGWGVTSYSDRESVGTLFTERWYDYEHDRIRFSLICFTCNIRCDHFVDPRLMPSLPRKPDFRSGHDVIVLGTSLAYELDALDREAYLEARLEFDQTAHMVVRALSAASRNGGCRHMRAGDVGGEAKGHAPRVMWSGPKLGPFHLPAESSGYRIEGGFVALCGWEGDGEYVSWGPGRLCPKCEETARRH